jgi:hypothetical protein
MSTDIEWSAEAGDGGAVWVRAVSPDDSTLIVLTPGGAMALAATLRAIACGGVEGTHRFTTRRSTLENHRKGR